MKIIYLITNIKKCGPFNVIETIINNINKQNKIYVISLFGKDEHKVVEKLKKQNIEVLNLNINKFTFFLTGAVKLKKILKDINPDVVHSHGILPDICLSKQKAVYKITTIHNNMFEDYTYNWGQIIGNFWVRIHLKCLKNIDKVICCSKTVYESINNYCNNSLYIRNGIEIKSLNIKEKEKNRKNLIKNYTLPNDAIIYVYAGVLTERKGIVELIKLFSKYHNENEYLFVLGDGPEKEKCLEEKNNNVIMVGFTNDVTKFQLAADIYVSNSNSEGFAISILEALANGDQLLLSDIPSHNEIISLDKNIYLGEIFNSNTFLESKEKLLKNRNLKKDISSIHSQISAKKMGNLYMDIYKKGDKNGK